MSVQKKETLERSIPPKPFPVEKLPAVMRTFVVEASDNLGCDPSFIALPLIAGLGRAIGNKRTIKLKSSWREPAVIWAAVIGSVSQYKSPARNQTLKYLSDLQNKENERIKELNKSLPPLLQLPLITILSTDATYAGVRDALEEQEDSSLLAVPDELVEVLRSISKGGQNFQKKGQWMSWWSGGELRVHRYRRVVHIPRVMLSIFGTIQPTVFRREIFRDHSLDDGLCARFLLTWQSPSTKAKPWSKKGMSKKTGDAMRSVFNRLYKMTTQKREGGTYYRPDSIPLSEGADHWWEVFYNRHNGELIKLDQDLKAAWLKLQAYAARLALIFQCADWAANEKQDLSAKGLEINGLSMQRGIKVIEWFKSEITTIYQLFLEEDEASARRDLVTTIKGNGGRITARQLMRKSWRHQSADSATKALNDLCKHGLAKWHAIPTTKKGGRDTQECVLTT